MKVTKEVVKVKDLKELGRNPRRISDRKLKQLTKSLDGFNQMLDINEIVIDEGNNILGGNQRFKALKKLKEKEVVVLRVTGLEDDKKDEFTIKDNIHYGIWDWDVLANTHDPKMLDEYGLSVWQPSEGNDDVEEVQTTTQVDEVAGEGTGELEEKCVVVIDFYSNDYDTAKLLIDEMQDKQIDTILYNHLKTICDA